MFVCGKVNNACRKQIVLVVESNINVKEWTGVHSSLEVSLHKDK
jgi:hypothetical protein